MMATVPATLLVIGLVVVVTSEIENKCLFQTDAFLTITQRDKICKGFAVKRQSELNVHCIFKLVLHTSKGFACT